MFNTNVDPESKQVSYSEKEFKNQLTEKLEGMIMIGFKGS